MSIMTILEAVLIGPLKIVFEIIFAMANRALDNPGLSIVALSLVMNILVLPLYKRADAMQEASREIEEKLHDGVAHIKKTFTGDERMMILQEYYRQNHYKPTDALNGSVSLLLEVPFFMAAYQFLSGLQLLHGVSLGPIADLGAPDAMIVLGGITLNALPVIMTLVNVISSAIYLKGFPLKTKVQLYAMAGFFLVFLYDSPSGLVFYWTLNNVFSLGKTIFYKVKNPEKVFAVGSGLAGVAALILSVVGLSGRSVKLRVLIIAVGLVLQIPVLRHLFGKKPGEIFPGKEELPNRKNFLMAMLLLTVLVGVLIPSNLIADEPQEFIEAVFFYNPLWYVFSTFCMAAGTFLVWMNVFYWLASPRGKVIFERFAWVLCGAMLVNYMFFATDMGVISNALEYENGLEFSALEQVLNPVILIVLAVVLYWVATKMSRKITAVLLTAILALGSMSAVNVVKIDHSVKRVPQQKIIEEGTSLFQLSKTGKNVVIIVLDRAMGEFVPYILEEKPDLKEKLAGFTYYDNVISFGGYTAWGSAPVFGGYEYTPVEMNKRDQEPMIDKHNEALKMMPVLFSQSGYSVTVCDPMYANYQWIPDLAIYNDYPEIKTYHTNGRFGDSEFLQQYQKVLEDNRDIMVNRKNRNFFCFSLMKTMPLVLQGTLYNSGMYNELDTNDSRVIMTSQRSTDASTASGMNGTFMASYNVLAGLQSVTEITEERVDTALILCNEATHEPVLLKAPTYEPVQVVDNREYDAANTERFSVNGRILKVDTAWQMGHYHANMAALLQLAEWFDYLRANGAYDNTRIILVSDHGRDTAQLEELIIDDGKGNIFDVESFYPLLMVKDFDSTEFTTDSTFMTQADVPTLATKDLIIDPKNPFTGKAITCEEKNKHPQFIGFPDHSGLPENPNTFHPVQWISVKENIWDESNWVLYEEKTILKEHYIP